MEKYIDDLYQLIDTNEIVKIIKGMAEIPSYPGIERQETGVAEYIKEYFEMNDVTSWIEEVSEGRSNVMAVLKGSGAGRSLLLTGHIDTVPPYDMENPFEIIEKEGCLFGRGVVDMKGQIACMMAAIIAIKKLDIELAGDVIFAGVIDEETGSLGTIHLIESGLQPDAAIVGEPSNMQICTAHRGLTWLEFSFKGKTVHGGMQHEGINAIQKAVDFINMVNSQLLPLIESEKHPVIGTSTLNWAVINGGTQPSTVPGSCILRADRRWVPGGNYDNVIKQFTDAIKYMQEKDSDFVCDMTVMKECVLKNDYVLEAMEISLMHPIVQLIDVSYKKIFNSKPAYHFFPAWTDAGLLYAYGNIPSVVFGPGDIESAHSKDENINIDSLLPASLIYARTAIEFCK